MIRAHSSPGWLTPASLSHLLLCSLPAQSMGPVMDSRKVQVDIGIKQNIKVMKVRGVALGKKLIPYLVAMKTFLLINFGGMVPCVSWPVCRGQRRTVRSMFSSPATTWVPGIEIESSSSFTH